MKLLQKILVITVILGAVYVPASYGAGEYNPYADSIPIPANKEKPAPTPKDEKKSEPVQKKASASQKKSTAKTTGKAQKTNKNTGKVTKKPVSAQTKVKTPAQSNTAVKTQPKTEASVSSNYKERSSLEDKIKYSYDLTRKELEQAFYLFPLYLMNWDFDNKIVELRYVHDNTSTAYSLKLGGYYGYGVDRDTLFRKDLKDILDKPIICAVPIDKQWKLSYSISISLQSVSASPLSNNNILSSTAPFGGRTYDVTGRHVNGTLEKNTYNSDINSVVFQGNTIVMFDSLEHLIKYFYLVPASK